MTEFEYAVANQYNPREPWTEVMNKESAERWVDEFIKAGGTPGAFFVIRRERIEPPWERAWNPGDKVRILWPPAVRGQEGIIEKIGGGGWVHVKTADERIRDFRPEELAPA